ncbi:MAG TPA: pyrimidine dimer DNA glycosylase/endonuclease V [Planctomicrobium sp.]|nr:pyrimidine dimer DNA glycosylase/endonuclease V [Planctomicrobium sp.]
MRLWTIHPKYLDPRGLVALWREGLLAQAVLHGETKGYQHHPQLERFKEQTSPQLSISNYLSGVFDDAVTRGYNFDQAKLRVVGDVPLIPATTGQRDLEWSHLLNKLAVRSPDLYEKWKDLKKPDCHPLFTVSRGPVATWERAE